MSQDRPDHEIMANIEARLAKVEKMKLELARMREELRLQSAKTRQSLREEMALAREAARAALHAARSRG